MTRKHPVRLLRSVLTGKVYAVTRYRFDDDGNIIPMTKHDVTADFNELSEAQERKVTE